MSENFNNFNIIEKLDSNTTFNYEKPNIILNSDFTKLEIKDDTNVTIIEVFDENIKEYDLKREFTIGKNSVLEYLKVSFISNDIKVSFDYKIQGLEKSNILFHLFEFSDADIKNTIDAKLTQKDMDLKINSLVKLKNNARSFNSFNISHIHSNTYSDISIRHLLDDNSRAEFEATSIVENKAQNSKAFQDSKTILLSDDAIIKARPHLEILTDELQASHGATTGGLDPEAIYYLQSRGLDEKSAYEILIEAFCNTQIENIENSTLKQWLYSKVGGYHA